MPSKSKNIAESQIYDVNSSSSGAFDIPVGTTAQRPGSPTSGYLRFNTTIQETEIYDGNNWLKINANTPNISSITGNIVLTQATTLTLAGSEFGSANLVVNFLQTADSINTNVTVTPSSEAAATVAVPAAVYNNVTAGNAVTIKVTNEDLKPSNVITKSAAALPTGGTVTTSGNFRIHTFNSSANFVNQIPSLGVQYLIVAGGASGGGYYYAGGGGAGGYRTNVTGQTSGANSSAESAMTLGAATFAVVVGSGGAAQGTANGKGNSGGNSSFNSIVSLGGGGGGSNYSSPNNNNGNTGGCGGGGSNNGTGANGTANQGLGGGGGGGAANSNGAGGGGGAGANGGGGSSGNAGAGGAGLSSNITGSAVTRSGGGGGGSGAFSHQVAGGAGGGGTGGTHGASIVAGAGTANTGGGGGGSSHVGSGTGTSGAGGSGIVIVRYDTTAL